MASRLRNCLELSPGEIEMAVKMRPTNCRTNRPRGALLQLGTDCSCWIVENRRETLAYVKVISGIPLVQYGESYLWYLETVSGTLSGG